MTEKCSIDANGGRGCRFCIEKGSLIYKRGRWTEGVWTKKGRKGKTREGKIRVGWANISGSLPVSRIWDENGTGEENDGSAHAACIYCTCGWGEN